MYRFNRLLLALIVGVFAVNMPAFAVMAAPGSSASMGRADQPFFPQGPQHGVITSIDVAGNAIVIDKVSYMFVPALTRMHAVDKRMAVNPLSLKPGQRIEYTVVPEGASKRRVESIFIRDEAE
ncbi:hypothetical protein SAMN06265795_116112 [Noviherbaspirillum humi]|uniref:Cu and Ag efflux protein CusF n=1 Tax=Noviherbaspirillum humi TaxID=1688639 RepID=A0A239KPD5_9BURK|nr:hypothetical protein [Noviherbaspirillum humi]SNT19538.1 hypothetical protein SAMN06265795_116112 [Noviherbaspirillum humi]